MASRIYSDFPTPRDFVLNNYRDLAKRSSSRYQGSDRRTSSTPRARRANPVLGPALRPRLGRLRPSYASGLRKLTRRVGLSGPGGHLPPLGLAVHYHTTTGHDIDQISVLTVHEVDGSSYKDIRVQDGPYYKFHPRLIIVVVVPGQCLS